MVNVKYPKFKLYGEKCRDNGCGRVLIFTFRKSDPLNIFLKCSICKK